MGLSMANLRAEILEHLGIDATDLDASGSANLDLLINRTWWDVIGRFDFKEKEKSTTFATVAGTRSYSIQTILGADLFEAIMNISIKDNSDSSHSGINPISMQWYEDNYSESSDLQAKPTNYFHLGGDIILYPTPDTVYTLTVYYRYFLSDLSATAPSIPQDWHEMIMYGAIGRGFRRARDLVSAREYEGMYEGEISKRATTTAKEDSESKFVGVQVYRNKYSVRH